MTSKVLQLHPIPPFRLDLTVWVLKRRPDYVVDDWDGKTFRRTLSIAGHLVGVVIQQRGTPDAPILDVTVHGASTAMDQYDLVGREIERLLGTSVDLTDFYRLAEDDDRLRPLVESFSGFKPTRYPTIFECLTNAITCQLVSLNVGLQVVSRLVHAYGTRVESDVELPPAFPTPRAIASADPDHLRQMGYSRQKARALIDLARGIETGEVDFGDLAGLDDATVIDRLTALRGIGRWTAEYTLLRGLGRLHVFPGDDVGARNTLQKWSQAAGPFNYQRVGEVLSDWKPYAGLLYFHMLLLGLESKGRITVQG